MTTGSIFSCIVLLLVCIFHIYNKLVRLFNASQNIFMQIDMHLNNRYNLVSNLIDVAKKYINNDEKALLTSIESRNNAKHILDSIDKTDIYQVSRLSTAEDNLNSALSAFSVVVDLNPALKENENMIKINNDIVANYGKMIFAKQMYNDSVTSYNTYKQRFPNHLVGLIFPRFHKNLHVLRF